MGVILGVTGVIGSGKSTACRLLRDEFGFHWIEADALVHEFYRAGGRGYEKIRSHFGERFVSKTEVRRPILRRFVLGNHQKLWILNKIMHPLITDELNKKVDQLKREGKGDSSSDVCIEAFYFEPQDLGRSVDHVIRIEASDELIKSRLGERFGPAEELEKMILFQRKILRESAFEEIRNEGREELLREKLAQLVGRLRREH
ncbi:dephospho-CoA kinase [Candidatus Peregrinibacteria bacterium CG_4_9_14_0_2_um_filter_53_11]|nr:MAG: dephospho-CoA kinase [Candidatus Peregrinibacteria bacterium CG_4_9_14_0_2_um_filter_53_11]